MTHIGNERYIGNEIYWDEAYWHEKYRGALDSLRQGLERRLERRKDEWDGGIIACGFTVNLDMVHKLQSRETGQVIEEVMGKGAIWAQDRQAQVPQAIETPQDFVAVLIRLLEEGRGGEWQVASEEMAEWLKARFPGSFKIGGTGAQVANALSSLGLRCLLHAPNLSCEQAKHLNGGIRIPRGGSLLAPLDACREGDSDELHCIIEYDPGLEVVVAGRTIRPAASNRIILPYDRVLSAFKLDRDFTDYVLNHAPAISSLLITGFNSLKAEEDWIDRVDRVAEFVEVFRSLNSEAFIHLEEGDTRCSGGRRYMIEHLYTEVDSVGMNEDEFRDITGVQPERDPVRSVEALRWLLETHGLERINLHTRDFSLSITRLDPEREQRAQLVASLIAANRARTGSFGDFEAVAQNIELPLSARGLAIGRQLQESIGLAGGQKEIMLNQQSRPAQQLVRAREAGRSCGAGEAWVGKRAWIVFSPARNVERPECTVGLGDSYTAGILAIYG